MLGSAEVDPDMRIQMKVIRKCFWKKPGEVEGKWDQERNNANNAKPNVISSKVPQRKLGSILQGWSGDRLGTPQRQGN